MTYLLSLVLLLNVVQDKDYVQSKTKAFVDTLLSSYIIGSYSYQPVYHFQAVIYKVTPSPFYEPRSVIDGVNTMMLSNPAIKDPMLYGWAEEGYFSGIHLEKSTPKGKVNLELLYVHSSNLLYIIGHYSPPIVYEVPSSLVRNSDEFKEFH